MRSCSSRRSNSDGERTTATGFPFSTTVTGSFCAASSNSPSLICPASLEKVRIAQFLQDNHNSECGGNLPSPCVAKDWRLAVVYLAGLNFWSQAADSQDFSHISCCTHSGLN